MFNEPGLSLQDLAMFAGDLKQILTIALFLINAVCQSLELCLILLELLNLLLQINNGSPSIVAFIELPIWVLVVEARLLSLFIFNKLSRIAIKKFLDKTHDRISVHQGRR